jgi:hypothetical protein
MRVRLHIVGPANQNDCITLCVGNLADKKFYAFNEVSRMKFLGTVIHRLTELCRTIANTEEIFIIIISLTNISLRYNEETKKLRKLIRNKLTRKQQQCTSYFC